MTIHDLILYLNTLDKDREVYIIKNMTDGAPYMDYDILNMEDIDASLEGDLYLGSIHYEYE